jgi:hypothetical protein
LCQPERHSLQCMTCFTTQASPIVPKIQPTIFILLCTAIPQTNIIPYRLRRYANKQKAVICAI